MAKVTNEEFEGRQLVPNLTKKQFTSRSLKDYTEYWVQVISILSSLTSHSIGEVVSVQKPPAASRILGLLSSSKPAYPSFVRSTSSVTLSSKESASI